MRLARALLLVSVCFLDLHVRADGTTFNAEAGRKTFAVADAKLVLAKGGLAREDEAHDVRLVRGAAYVAGGLTLVTPFARFSCAGACEAIFTREDEAIAIETLTEGWSLTRTGDAREYAVGAAMRVKLGAVARDGRAEMAAAETLPWASLITRWAALYVAGAEKFTDHVHEFRPVWEAAVERLSYAQRARSVAMVDAADAEARRRAARRQAEADEDARIRAEFRARNYVVPAIHQ